MKLAEIWSQYETYSKGASDGARQIAFAGIAIVWLFKVDRGEAIHLEWLLLKAGGCFIAALGFDLLQYVAGTLIYYLLGMRRQELSGHARDTDYPDWVLWPLDFFFYGKLWACLSWVCGIAEIFSRKVGLAVADHRARLRLYSSARPRLSGALRPI